MYFFLYITESNGTRFRSKLKATLETIKLLVEQHQSLGRSVEIRNAQGETICFC